MSEGRTPGRQPSVTDDEILSVFDAAVDPVLTTDEVASRLPIGNRATLDRLRSLESAGDLNSKSVGARGVVWWKPDGESTVLSEDPFLTSPTYASGRTDISAAVDEALAETHDDGEAS